MIHRVQQFLCHRQYRTATVVAVALSFFLSGLVVASNLPGANMSEAEPQVTSPQAVMTAPTIPSSFAELAKRLSPTVVNIKVTKMAKQAGWQGPYAPDGPFGEFFKHFFKDMPHFPEQFKQRGAGSGVIISADGYILTNNHVIEGADEVLVTLADQQEYKADVVGRDPKTDLAVLKITAPKPLPMATMGDSDQLPVGAWVLAIGNPFGLSHTVTSGIVSAKGRVIGAGPYDDFIQTDASINPGNSGGPLFNMQGEVVGINTAIVPQGQGIGFAIPVNTAKPLLPQLMTKGVVTRGYLGVSIQGITPDLATAMGLQDRKGALVAEVVPGGPAEKAGMLSGDVIVTFNHDTVDSAHDLPAMVAATPVGQEVTVTVLRDGTTRDLPVTVGKLPTDDTEVAESSQDTQGKWGLQLQTITPEVARQHDLATEQGVLVVGVQPGSPAEQAGIRPGDILVEVNRQPVTSSQEVKEVLAKASDKTPLLVRVQRGQGSLFVAMAK
jgi:serine protease Do